VGLQDGGEVFYPFKVDLAFGLKKKKKVLEMI